MNGEEWADWSPRLGDQWSSFLQPYRHRTVDLISQYTPQGGTVLDFGCGVGIQSFLLHLKRPDLHVTGMDINAQSRFYSKLLCETEMIDIIPPPEKVTQFSPFDTIFTVYTMCYFHPDHILTFLQEWMKIAKTIILVEPTTIDENFVYKITGFPCECWQYPYKKIVEDKLGGRATVELIQTPSRLNAITIVQ